MFANSKPKFRPLPLFPHNHLTNSSPGRRNKGFGFRSQSYRVGPGNCTVRKLCEPLFTEAVLDFLEKTDVGKVKKGVIMRGEAVM